MSKKLSDDTLRWTLDVNGQPAIKELGSLEQATRGLEKTNKDLNMELRKMEAAGKKNTTVYKNLKRQYTENNQAIAANKNRMADLRKEIGLGGLTARQLRTEFQRLKTQMDNTTPNTPEWRRLKTELAGVQAQQQRVNGGLKQTNGLFGQMKNLLPALGLAYLARETWNFLRGLLETNVQLQLWEKRAKIVFGQEFPMATKQAELHAKALGLTTREYVNAASATADLMVPLNFTRKESAKMALDMMHVAGALDEWTAGAYGAQEVSTILTKAMLGEAEQIKRLGVVIDQSSKEYNKRIEQLQEDQNLTRDQARAIEIYNQIMEKSVDAQNAFADSTDNLLRKKKNYSLFWKDLKEASADYLSSFGDFAMYIPQTFALAMNEVKRFANDFLMLQEKLAFDVDPLTEFSEAILYADQRFKFLVERVESLGIESEEGTAAMAKLKHEMQNIYGDEGLEVFNQFYDQQIALAVKRIRIAKEEEARIKAESDARLLKEQEEADKKAQEAALKAIDDQNEAKKLLIMQQRADGKLDEEAYQIELSMLEFAYLETRKQAFIRFGEDVTKINQDIATAQIRLIAQMEAAQKSTMDLIIKAGEEKLDELWKFQDAQLDAQMQSEQERITKERKTMQERFDAFKQDAENRKAITTDLATSVGELIGRSIADTEFGMDNFIKGMLSITLDALHSIVRIMIGQIWAQALATPESIATWGIAGVAKATALTALVEGAFALAKSAVRTNQAATGRYDVLGAQDGRMYSASYTGNVTRSGIQAGGRPTLINEHGGEAILTAPHVRNLQTNYPSIMHAIMATRVPQRASGQYSQVMPMGMSDNNDETNRVLAMMTDAIYNLNDRLRMPIKADLSYTEFERKSKMIEGTRSKARRRG